MLPQSTTSYDEFPYPSHPYPQTHPDHLAAVATLLGLAPPPADRCRVLEIGCAGGGNLIPLALTLPHSRFLGIDLSSKQIADGKRLVDALGLTNVELRHLSVLDVDESFGRFEYVICHGVYSWVPGNVQEKILSVCRDNLAENGIGYVSYNTYPGWYVRGMVRDMMRFHVSRFDDPDPTSAVGRARGLLAFLARSVLRENGPYATLLREELELLRQHSDSYLFHEHLEECNDPIYFLQFCERLRTKGLRYLGEADFCVMVAATSFPPEVRQVLDELAPDLLHQEQYMDFLRNRQFRQSLICHGHARPRYDLRAAHLFGLRIASPLRATSAEPDLLAEAPVEFSTPSGLGLTTAAPAVKVALACLADAWPRSLPFGELLAQARARLGGAAGDEREDATEVGRAFLTAYATAGNRLVELSLLPRPFVTEVSERPATSPLARLQAAEGQRVTTPRHEPLTLGEFDKHLLPLLDGTRDRAALVAALTEKCERGALNVSRDGEPVAHPAEVAVILAELLRQRLPALARLALLTA